MLTPHRLGPARGVFEVAGLEARVDLLREAEEVVRVRAADVVPSTSLAQTVARVFANGLEHPVALGGIANEALVDERLQKVEIGARDLLGGDQRRPSREHSQAG